jgi:hypothetical protein
MQQKWKTREEEYTRLRTEQTAVIKKEESLWESLNK